MKKLAMFDIDKTIFNGYVIFPLADDQFEKKLIDKNCLDALYQDLDEYKSGRMEYEVLIATLLDHWAEGLKGKSAKLVQKEANNYFNQNKNKFFDFVEPIIKKLLETHDVYFITGESEFVAIGAASLFNPTGHISSELEVKDGLYTGGMARYLATREEKLDAIQHLVEKYNMSNSFAFGDSEGDIQMLSQVENAFCINATDGLKEEASKNGWYVTKPEEVESLVFSKL
jgi:phosphoserine phosphatase